MASSMVTRMVRNWASLRLSSSSRWLSMSRNTTRARDIAATSSLSEGLAGMRGVCQPGLPAERSAAARRMAWVMRSRGWITRRVTSP
jgi:hypothetical protein